MSAADTTHDTRDWERRALRCGTAILGAFAVAVMVGWGVRPLGAQGRGLISGHAQTQAGRPCTPHLVQAQDIQTGEIVATSEIDENTAEYELASLPEGSFLVELVDHDDGAVLRTIGPFEIVADRVYEDRNIGCDDSPWYSRWRLPLLAGVAAATTIGVLLRSVDGAPTLVALCHGGTTITVERKAVPEYLGRGASLGACPTSPSR